MKTYVKIWGNFFEAEYSTKKMKNVEKVDALNFSIERNTIWGEFAKSRFVELKNDMLTYVNPITFEEETNYIIVTQIESTYNPECILLITAKVLWR